MTLHEVAELMKNREPVIYIDNDGEEHEALIDNICPNGSIIITYNYSVRTVCVDELMRF